MNYRRILLTSWYRRKSVKQVYTVCNLTTEEQPPNVIISGALVADWLSSAYSDAAKSWWPQAAVTRQLITRHTHTDIKQVQEKLLPHDVINDWTVAWAMGKNHV